jgi:hypothetical protein
MAEDRQLVKSTPDVEPPPALADWASGLPASGVFRHHKKRAFLTAFAATGNIQRAALASGVDRSTHYDWLQRDPEYPAVFDQVRNVAIEYLEAVAHHRATRSENPSDLLLIFLLKAARPEVYRDNLTYKHRHEHAHVHASINEPKALIELMNGYRDELRAEA